MGIPGWCYSIMFYMTNQTHKTDFLESCICRHFCFSLRNQMASSLCLLRQGGLVDWAHISIICISVTHTCVCTQPEQHLSKAPFRFSLPNSYLAAVMTSETILHPCTRHWLLNFIYTNSQISSLILIVTVAKQGIISWLWKWSATLISDLAI